MSPRDTTRRSRTTIGKNDSQDRGSPERAVAAKMADKKRKKSVHFPDNPVVPIDDSSYGSNGSDDQFCLAADREMAKKL